MPFWYLHNADGLLRIVRMQISFYIMNTLMAFSFYAAILPQRQQTRDTHSLTDCLVLGWWRTLLEGSLVPYQTAAWGAKICKEIHNTLILECKSTLSYHNSHSPAILPSYINSLLHISTAKWVFLLQELLSKGIIKDINLSVYRWHSNTDGSPI